MLLSNEIEKALYNGECVYKTFNTGYTNTFTIPIPKGSYIILRQIIYYPVISSNATDFNLRTTLQLSLTEQGSNNELLYLFRNNINQINLGTIFATDYVYTGGNPQIVETFKVFKKNCCIDIGFNDKPTNLIYPANEVFRPEANERLTPLGYDTIPTQPQVVIAGGNRLYPTGEQREFTNAYSPGNKDRLRYSFDGGNKVPNVDILNKSAGYEFPLFTFGYFEFQTAKSINLQ